MDNNYKVKCIKGSAYFKKDGIYEVKDGHITMDNGDVSLQYFTIEEINHAFCAKFELAEEEVVKMKFNIGDRVTATADLGSYKIKGLSGVIKDLQSHQYDCTVEFDNNIDGHTGNSNCKNGHGLHLGFALLELDTRSITITTLNSITTATLYNGTTAIKTKIATCNPLDKFSFGVGARVAFGRLMGEEVKEIEVKKSIIKEVEREAKIGEWVKVISKDTNSGNYNYKNGDVMQIVKCKRSCIPAHYEDRTGRFLWQREYAVLENYTPPVKVTEVKEVERMAKVGEWIKIMKAYGSYGKYENGDILQVSKSILREGYNSEYVVATTSKASLSKILTREYVVLENYIPSKQPIKAPKIDCSTLDYTKLDGTKMFAEIQRRVNL